MQSCAGSRGLRLANRTRSIVRYCRRRRIASRTLAPGLSRPGSMPVMPPTPPMPAWPQGRRVGRLAAAHLMRLQIARLERVPSPRVWRCPRTPLPHLARPRPARMRHRFVRQAWQTAIAVTARQHRRSYPEATTTLSPDGCARPPSRKRIRACARSCGRNTQTIVEARRRSDDRWRFVSEAVRAGSYEPRSAWNTVRPLKVLARNWPGVTYDGREDCLGLGCRATSVHTGTCAAPLSPMRS